jgi:hypothetical protein
VRLTSAPARTRAATIAPCALSPLPSTTASISAVKPRSLK